MEVVVPVPWSGLEDPWVIDWSVRVWSDLVLVLLISKVIRDMLAESNSVNLFMPEVLVSTHVSTLESTLVSTLVVIVMVVIVMVIVVIVMVVISWLKVDRVIGHNFKSRVASCLLDVDSCGS